MGTLHKAVRYTSSVKVNISQRSVATGFWCDGGYSVAFYRQFFAKCASEI